MACPCGRRKPVSPQPGKGYDRGVAAFTSEHRTSWDRDGFVVLRRFVDTGTCTAMTARIVAIAQAQAGGESITPSFVLPETAMRDVAGPAEGRVSKIFNLHRHEPVFREFSRNERLLDLVQALIGPDFDSFLSQFIFKNAGAMGQPWHQDAYYFPFDRQPQIGVWLAVTEATRANGPLWVLPASHREPVHDVVPDRREGTNLGYVEIVDHDMAAATPVLMQPGDLLLFHSHLMHRSTDNEAATMRAAMVYHYTPAGTVDGTEQHFGFKSPNNDFVPVRRGGRTVDAAPG